MEARRVSEAEAIERERQLVRDAIGLAVEKFASKDMTFRISQNLPSAYGKLKDDFNAAIEIFEDVIRKLSDSTAAISSGTMEISTASDDLSRRTETQAANLEETAAAVADITSKVKQTAAGAALARDVVAGANEQANSLQQVNEAVDNMDQSTQQNAAMVEQATAATKHLALQSDELDEIVGTFVTSARRMKAAVKREGGPRPVREPSLMAPRRPRSSSSSRTGTDDWQEF